MSTMLLIVLITMLTAMVSSAQEAENSVCNCTHNRTDRTPPWTNFLNWSPETFASNFPDFHHEDWLKVLLSLRELGKVVDTVHQQMEVLKNGSLKQVFQVILPSEYGLPVPQPYHRQQVNDSRSEVKATLSRYCSPNSAATYNVTSLASEFANVLQYLCEDTLLELNSLLQSFACPSGFQFKTAHFDTLETSFMQLEGSLAFELQNGSLSDSQQSEVSHLLTLASNNMIGRRTLRMQATTLLLPVLIGFSSDQVQQGLQRIRSISSDHVARDRLHVVAMAISESLAHLQPDWGFAIDTILAVDHATFVANQSLHNATQSFADALHVPRTATVANVIANREGRLSDFMHWMTTTLEHVRRSFSESYELLHRVDKSQQSNHLRCQVRRNYGHVMPACIAAATTAEHAANASINAFNSLLQPVVHHTMMVPQNLWDMKKALAKAVHDTQEFNSSCQTLGDIYFNCEDHFTAERCERG